MRNLTLIAAALLPIAAFAQQPTTVTLPAPIVEHALAYLHQGGTRSEADALAEQLLAAAQADVVKQQQAKAAPPTTTAPAPAADKP